MSTQAELQIAARVVAGVVDWSDAEDAKYADQIEGVRFCDTCGVEVRPTQAHAGYNVQSGIPFGVEIRRCPNGHRPWIGWRTEGIIVSQDVSNDPPAAEGEHE